MARKKYSFEVKAGECGSSNMFYSDNNAENRCIGYIRGDFGGGGTEYWPRWFPLSAVEHDDNAFRNEMEALEMYLRRDLLKSRVSMQKYLREHDSLMLESGSFTARGYKVTTEQYEYYIRCQPHPGDYNFYIYVYAREEA